ncbi:MAG: hypothetical protein KIPDCIKN_04379 [Haliscomenobacter sp.]|nr:hypothetical protein [Haliscomenobacter sp.]
MENNNQKEDLHFDISARVIRQLGEELVTDEITAIMELVKNAYDADADWVKISIHTNPDDSRIEIEDNGTGMSFEDIKSGWLYISLSKKKQAKQEKMLTDKGRAPLGEKGLGRLSAQKLGNVLELITGQLNEQVGHSVAFNWMEFDKEIELTSVPIYHKLVNKKANEKGTKLVIRDLRSRTIWEKDGIDAFRGQLSQMIFPIKEKRPFHIYLTANGSTLDLDEINESIRKAAVGRFNFLFDGQNLRLNGAIKLAKLKANDSDAYQSLIEKDRGKEFFAFLTDETRNRKNYFTNLEYKSGFEGLFVSFSFCYDWEKDFKKYSTLNPETKELEPANPGPFQGEIDEYALNYLIDDSGSDFSINLSEHKKLIQNQIGVRVFRNGFGIKPFGFDKMDWLNLASGQTSGGSFYGIRPNNIIGFVALSVYDNINLVEKTDREGFTDSSYSKNFFALMHKVVQDINLVYEKIRRSYNDFRTLSAQEKGSIRSQVDSAERLKKTADLASKIEDKAAKLSNEFSQLAENTKTQVDFTEKNPLFAKEAENVLLPLLRQVQDLLARGGNLLKEINEMLPLAKQLKSDADFIIPKIKGLEDQLAQFSELAGLGLTAEALTHELFNILDRVSAQTDSLSARMKSMKEVDTAFFVYLEQVKTFIKNIRIQINHLAPSLKYNREQKQDINLEAFVKDLKAYFENRFFAQGIEFVIEPRRNFSIRMNVGKLTQVFDNLILNSEYWLREKAKTDVVFKPKITIEIEDPIVRIFDNGNGISPEIEGTIFQPFVTTKPRDVGRGLGLFISQQILESQGGEIYLLLQRNDAGRRFIFQMNLDSVKK